MVFLCFFPLGVFGLSLQINSRNSFKKSALAFEICKKTTKKSLKYLSNGDFFSCTGTQLFKLEKSRVFQRKLLVSFFYHSWEFERVHGRRRPFSGHCDQLVTNCDQENKSRKKSIRTKRKTVIRQFCKGVIEINNIFTKSSMKIISFYLSGHIFWQTKDDSRCESQASILFHERSHPSYVLSLTAAKSIEWK